MAKKKWKAPSFQFYASDFYLDTIAWTDEMVGRHIRLMCQQWVNDFIESDEDGYPINSTLKQKQIFDKIKHKYFAEKGRIKNKRLDKVKKEKKDFIKKAVETGKDGALRRWGKDRVPYKKSIGIEKDTLNKPHEKNIALHSSSSSSINKQQVVEFLRAATDRQFISNRQIETETENFIKKYQGTKIINLRALCNTWADGIIPEPKKEVQI